MRKIISSLFLLILFSSLIIMPEQIKATYVPSPVTVNITPSGAMSDGYVSQLTGTYTKVDGSGGHLYSYYTGAGTAYNGWADFDTTIIPINATITGVVLHTAFQAYGNTAKKITHLPATGASLADTTLYYDVISGAVYYTSATGLSTGTYYAWDLGASAVADLQTQLAAHWFSIGYYTAVVSAATDYYPRTDGTYHEYLSVTYNAAPTTYQYNLSAKWENGTATTITATVTEPGSTSTISVTGTPTTYYFTTQPISISWDLGAGVSRSIFIVGPTATIVLTKPSLTNAVYSFTIQDYTATIGDANSYLEAWRTIGGTPILVEREQIFNRASTTPLTLQLYAAYNLFIRLPNNSTENYGYFVPTTNSPPYLTITKLTFAQMYQPVSKWVTDSITRVNATHIQVHYNDTLLQTTSTVVTIKNNLGTTIYSTTVAGNAFTVNWYAAISSTDYVVSYNATNTYYRWITDVRSLPGTFIPSHTVDWTPIGLPSAWIAVFLVLGGFFVVSAANRDLGVISGAAIAACTDYLHLSAFGIGIIIIVGIVGVLIALRGVFKY